MTTISQTTFWNVLSSVKKCEFQSNFTKIYFQWSSWEQDSIDSNNGLALDRQQAIILTNDGLVSLRHIYHPELR